MLFSKRRSSHKRSCCPRRGLFSAISGRGFDDRHRSLRLEPLEDRQMLTIMMVDVDAAPGGDGLAWESAYDDLQDAISQAAVLNTDGDTGNDVDQIWIAEGTYTPSAELESGDVRSASFSLVDSVTLYGGFAGTETTLDERDISANLTTLSGDLGTINDNSDNAYTVVYCGNTIEASLNGLSITGGNADGDYDSSHPERMHGGGIYNNSGTLTVTNSTLSGNSTNSRGGGIYNSSGTLTVTNSTLSGNSASDDGGGIYHYRGTATLNNTIVANNMASRGSDIYRPYGTLTGSSNLIGDGTDQPLENGTDGNQVGTSSSPIDPMFIDPTNGDYRLSAGSPAIDAGNNALAVDDDDNPLSTDLDESTRIKGASVDVGAYESNVSIFQALLFTPNYYLATEASMVSVIFSRPLAVDVDYRNFVALSGPNGGIVVDSFEVINGTTLRLEFMPLTMPGEYRIVIDPSMPDTLGELLDQDGDGFAGESTDDAVVHSWFLDSNAFTVFTHYPTSAGVGQLSHVDLIFSREINGNSLGVDDVTITAPGGSGFAPTSIEEIDENGQKVYGSSHILVGANRIFRRYLLFCVDGNDNRALPIIVRFGRLLGCCPG